MVGSYAARHRGFDPENPALSGEQAEEGDSVSSRGA